MSNPYNLSYWSDGYVTVDTAGDLCVRPNPQVPLDINLAELRKDLQQQGVRLPALVRFPEILHHRVKHLTDAFAEAQQQFNYRGGYTPVYPIKVNQQQPVVEHIIAGQQAAGIAQIGLEAGSKPELLAVLAQVQGHQALIVCNGYKDRHFIRLALMAEKLGHRVFLVIEKISELTVILQEAQRLNVQPRLGLRSRLASVGQGNWQNTGGEKSKFGLSAAQILAVVTELKQLDQLHCLQLLHFHLGSQLANIQDIHNGLRECRQVFADLYRLGAPLNYIDVGGGLGVDYEGSRSRNYCSMNYSIHEYARNVVAALAEICQQLDLPQPHIITESGRAMTAHHAVLLTEIIDTESATGDLHDSLNNNLLDQDLTHASAAQQALKQVLNKLDDTSQQYSLVELYHDSQHWLNDAQLAYTMGQITLEERARIEALNHQIGQQLLTRLDPANRSHRSLIDELSDKLATKAFVNFSLFQSLPDVWGIDQIFPILPLQKLHQAANQQVVLQDITCDSDGRIDRYVATDSISNSLALPSAEAGDLLAIFLVGAYQEILGDMHNLFGDTDAVNVVLSDQGGWQLSDISCGDSINDVLDYVNYCPNDLLQRLLKQVSSSTLNDAEQALLKQELQQSMKAYTYLEGSHSGQA